MCAGKSVTCALISPFVPRTCPISMGGPSSSASQIAVEKGAGARHVPLARQEGCAFTVSVLQHARGSAAAVCQPVAGPSAKRLRGDSAAADAFCSWSPGPSATTGFPAVRSSRPRVLSRPGSATRFPMRPVRDPKAAVAQRVGPSSTR